MIPILYCLLVWLCLDRVLTPVRMVLYMLILLGVATLNLFLLRNLEPEQDWTGGGCRYVECSV